MSSLSTHVLDATTGTPAADVAVQLGGRVASGAADSGDGWSVLASGTTDDDGRIKDLGADLGPGTYRVTFDTAGYHRSAGQPTFFPEVSITFVIDQERHYHVPLLLSPYSFSTYRGS